MSKTGTRQDHTVQTQTDEYSGGMSLQPERVSFGRHESFPLRFGWIAKGLEAVRSDPTVFVREDATVRLGVGKNMVTAIRHWLQAARLIRPSARGEYVETEIGRIAFGEDGDPYLEDDATIWLVHWLLAANPSVATTIYWFFNHFHKPAFASDEVAAALATFGDREVSARISRATLQRDVAMLLRMYTRTPAGTRLTLEDALDSPLSLLDLVDRVDAHHHRSPLAERPDLPLPTFAFAVAELFRNRDAPHVGVTDLMYSDTIHCAPGAVFRMTEEGLVRKLEELCNAAPNAYRLDRTAGVDQLYSQGRSNPLAVLADSYVGNGRAAA
ncbi:MAG: DUF4007 family protein [Gammaproteobacteria bacterium]|nr:DUF4007 family protein [Gammaproteobacteria bacterium]